MRRSQKILISLFLLPLVLMLLGCSSAKPTANPNLAWRIDLSKYELKDKLEAVVTVQQYVGTTQEFHQKLPSSGNMFLIMKLTITKQTTDVTPFDWSGLTVKDSTGNAYSRVGNDTFLTQFNYEPRMTGLPIKLGVNEGWVCYEIPAQAANGPLTLAYDATGSQQQIVIKK